MTPDPTEIRDRNAAYLRILAENPTHAASMTCRVVCEDRAWALAEVDRLTAEVRIRAHHGESWADGRDKERARILARVEGLPDAFADGWHGECMDRAAVIAAIKGEATE